MAQLIEQEFGVGYHEGHVWKILIRLGWSPQRPTGRARERNEKQLANWKKKVWPGIKKALKEGRTLVFVDESGLSQRPHRVRTLAPRGQTPVHQYCFNWKNLSAAAGLTVGKFYFPLVSRRHQKFLKALVRHLPGPLLLVWDRLRVFRPFLQAGETGKLFHQLLALL